MHLRTAEVAPRPDNDWVVLGASVVGTSHLARQSPCQDAHGGVVLQDGTLVLAVADGAGSARYSEQGSRLAVHASVAAVANALLTATPQDADGWQARLLEAMRTARASLAAQAEEVEGSRTQDFATTLLLLVQTNEVVASLQVGDGAIVFELEDGALELLTSTRSSEYVNETTFITSEDAEAKALISVRSLGSLRAVALFTDGVEGLAIEQAVQRAYPPFFRSLFEFARAEDAEVEQVEAMLSSERVNQLTDDDKTLVVAVRCGDAQ